MPAYSVIAERAGLVRSGKLYSLLQRERAGATPHARVGAPLALYAGSPTAANLIDRSTCILRATVMFDADRIRTVAPLDLRSTPTARTLAEFWQRDVRKSAARALGFLDWEDVAKRARQLLGEPPWVMELIAWEPPEAFLSRRAAA